jgi:hypothetical protein
MVAIKAYSPRILNTCAIIVQKIDKILKTKKLYKEAVAE